MKDHRMNIGSSPCLGRCSTGKQFLAKRLEEQQKMQRTKQRRWFLVWNMREKRRFIVTKWDTGVFKVSREKWTMIETGRRAEELPSPRHGKWSCLQGFHGKEEFWAILESISLGNRPVIPAADRNSPLLNWALTYISLLTLHSVRINPFP